MGKHGPCYHCGVTSTPLWRNGPPEKPILCNACGSRWRTKGTLANYTPLHARAEPGDVDDYRPSRGRNVSGKNKDARFFKRKHGYDYEYAENGVSQQYSHCLLKSFEEDTSNRSSSGSVLSNQDNVQFGSPEVSDMTGQAQSNIWDTTVPSRKRTCLVGRAKQPSPVEKLAKDLCTILHEQQSASCVSGSCEDDLLFESDRPMVSVEIGHGGVLIRHPSSIGGEEESEASSLSVDNKVLSVNVPTAGSERIKKPFGQGMDRELMKRDDTKVDIISHNHTQTFIVCEKLLSVKHRQCRLWYHLCFRDKDQLEELPILAHLDSPLGYIDLQDVKSEKISNETESMVVGTDDIKQPQDGHLPNDSDGNAVIKSPKTATNRGSNDTITNDGSSYSPKLPSDHNHCLELIDPIGFATISAFDQEEEEEEEDLLLLDVPSNSSFPQAELFFPIPNSFQNLACPLN